MVTREVTFVLVLGERLPNPDRCPAGQFSGAMRSCTPARSTRESTPLEARKPEKPHCDYSESLRANGLLLA